MEGQPDILKRMESLPALNCVYMKSVSFYGKAKKFSFIVNLSTTCAEIVLSNVSDRAKPIVAIFGNQISVANNLACKTLDVLEKKWPIIKKTPEEISSEASRLYNDNVASPALRRYHQTKQGASDLILSLQLYSIRKTGEFSETKYGRKIAEKFDSLLLIADSYVDKHLPAIHESDDRRGRLEISPTDNITVKVTIFYTKLARRVHVHAMVHYRASRDRVIELLAKLYLTVELLDTLKMVAARFDRAFRSVLAAYRERLDMLWDDLTESNFCCCEDSYIEEIIVMLCQNLAEMLIFAYLDTTAEIYYLPTRLRRRLATTLKCMFYLCLEFSKTTSFKEASELFMAKAQEAVDVLFAALDKLSERSPYFYVDSASDYSDNTDEGEEMNYVNHDEEEVGQYENFCLMR